MYDLRLSRYNKRRMCYCHKEWGFEELLERKDLHERKNKKYDILYYTINDRAMRYG